MMVFRVGVSGRRFTSVLRDGVSRWRFKMMFQCVSQTRLQGWMVSSVFGVSSWCFKLAFQVGVFEWVSQNDVPSRVSVGV